MAVVDRAAAVVVDPLVAVVVDTLVAAVEVVVVAAVSRADRTLEAAAVGQVDRRRGYHLEVVPATLLLQEAPETLLPQKAIQAASGPTATQAPLGRVTHRMRQDLTARTMWQGTDFTLLGATALAAPGPNNLLLRPLGSFQIQVRSRWTNAALSFLVIWNTITKDSALFLRYAMVLVPSDLELPMIA